MNTSNEKVPEQSYSKKWQILRQINTKTCFETIPLNVGWCFYDTDKTIQSCKISLFFCPSTKKLFFRSVLKLHLGFYFSYTDQTHAEDMSTVHQRCSHLQLLYELYGTPPPPTKKLAERPKTCKIPPDKLVQQLKGPPSRKLERFF